MGKEGLHPDPNDSDHLLFHLHHERSAFKIIDVEQKPGIGSGGRFIQIGQDGELLEEGTIFQVCHVSFQDSPHAGHTHGLEYCGATNYILRRANSDPKG